MVLICIFGFECTFERKWSIFRALSTIRKPDKHVQMLYYAMVIYRGLQGVPGLCDVIIHPVGAVKGGLQL